MTATACREPRLDPGGTRLIRIFDIAFPIMCAVGYLCWMARYLWTNSLDYPIVDPLAQLIAALSAHRAPFLQQFHFDPNYPPLQRMVSSLFFSLVGQSERVAYLSVSLFTAFTAVPLYYSGKWLAGRTAGILAVVLFLSSPFTFTLGQLYLNEAAVTFTVALYTCCYLYSEQFRGRTFSILAGAALGLGLLAKWSFIFFVLPMVAVPVLSLTVHLIRARSSLLVAATLCVAVAIAATLPLSFAVRPRSDVAIGFALVLVLLVAARRSRGLPVSPEAESRRCAVNIVLAATVACILSLPWYYDKFEYIRNQANSNLFHIERIQPVQYFLGVLTAFFGGNLVLYPVGFVYPFFARRSELFILLASAILGFAIVATINTPSSGRHLYPVMPVLVLCCVAWLKIVKSWRVQTAIIICAIFLQVMMYKHPAYALSANVFTTAYARDPTCGLPPSLTRFREARDVRPQLDVMRSEMASALTTERSVFLVFDDALRLGQAMQRYLAPELIHLMLVEDGFEVQVGRLPPLPPNPGGMVVLVSWRDKPLEQIPEIAGALRALRLVRSMTLMQMQVRVLRWSESQPDGP